jgi:hypothetical protein
MVLDTNVFSEVLKPAPSGVVLRWLGRQDRLAVFTTTITQAELLYGVEVLPAGKRRAMGRPISQPDAMIVAIAQSHHAAVATCNAADFDHCGTQVIDPWSEPDAGRHRKSTRR